MNQSAPLVSVIMPVFNGEKYIRQAIDSILQQTHRHLELIIINDGSTDNTAAIIADYQKIDNRILYAENKKNSKEWWTRNLGIEKAKGDYIAWQDADDVADRTRLAKQLSFLQNNKSYQLVASDMLFINQHGKKIGTATAAAQNKWLHRQKIFCPSLMFHKKILRLLTKPYHRPLPIGTDIDLLYRLLDKKYHVGLVHQPLYHYRRSSNQATNFHFLSLLYGELVRYDSYSRRFIAKDKLVFKNGLLLQASDLPAAFIPFLREKKLASMHTVFIHRFIIGQYYSFFKNLFKNPFVLIKYFPLLLHFYFILLRYQFVKFFAASVYSLPYQTIRYCYCKLMKKEFFVE